MKIKRFLLIIGFVLAAALVMAVPVLAQGTEPPAPPTSIPAQVGLVDVVFLMAATAFFKTQFNWSGKAALLTAGAVGLVLALLPQISLVFPAAAPWFETIVDFLKLFLGGAGAYDLVTGIGSKIAQAQAQAKG